MIRKCTFIWALVATAGLAFPVATLAQEGQPTSTSTPSTKKQPSSEEKRRAADAKAEDDGRREPTRYDIEFSGGQVREYVQALREATKPDRVNVVTTESLLNAKLGEISLQNVTVDTAVKALEWAMDSRGVAVSVIGPNTFGLNDRRAPGQVITSSQESKIEVQVMSLRDVIESLPGDPEGIALAVTPDVVLTAIRAAVESDAAQTKPELKFHADSGLLIMRGNREQINAANSVLGQISSDIARRRSAAKQVQTVRVDLNAFRAEAEKSKIKTQFLEQAFAAAAQDLVEAEGSLAKGVGPREAVASARVRMDKARADLDTARIDMGMAVAQLDAAQRAAIDEAVKQGRPGEGGLGDFPAGRSVVTYATSAIEADDLEGAGAALKKLAENIYGAKANVAIKAQGDTLVVTADRDSQRLIRRALIDGTNAKGGTFVQKTAPKPVDENAAPPR